MVKERDSSLDWTSKVVMMEMNETIETMSIRLSATTPSPSVGSIQVPSI